MTFHGAPRADKKIKAHVHESPKVMIVPLLVLAAGAMFMGYLGYESFVGGGAKAFWGEAILVLESHPALEAAHNVPLWVKYLPLAVAAAGIGLAYVLYMLLPALPGQIAARARGLYQFLLNKWYFDELYDLVFVRPAFYLGRGFWKGGDGSLIDGIGPDGVSAAVRHLARRAGAIQTGYLYHYAFAMLAGVVVLMTWYLFRNTG